MRPFLSAVRVAGLVITTVFVSLSAQAEQKLVPSQSEIAFVSKQMGVSVEGHFKKFDAQIAFDPAKPELSKIAFSIDVASATLGAPESDAELPKAIWFNAAKFPQASFQSTSVKGLSGGLFEIAGKLNIKGNVREILIPVRLTQSGSNAIATGAFSIKRLAFKIGENEWADTSMVADDVQVKFKLALTGVGKY